ncbi:MAG: hypothetical protein J7500_18645 [Sphingomonas sp.]|uniref:hypothetical protein n=1 Tax=Sphingomonas sp. TaxID=28214 RepID=UPI001B1B8E0B|nr:hypothetical protein [Sphingomonas sp.]MBO9624731.1 hypothetical protein [Sphingomonas sp.]
MAAAAPRLHRHDIAAALGLALLLGLAWTLRGWSDLSALRLPDTDDVMRLQQIRDWIAGQAFGDLAQHRLGPAPGLEMHWSRLPDLVPAALITGMTPLLGRHGAEVMAVVAWPVMLFAGTLLLTAAIARALGASGALAATLGALAYPATSLFMPGRIDHHSLQLLLLLVVVRSLVGRGTARAGLAAGIATAASFAIGLETAPLLALAVAAATLLWVRDEDGAHARLCGYAVGLVLSLAGAAALLRTRGWTYPACDGFTENFWRAGQFAAVALLALAVFGFGLHSRRARLLAAVAAGAAASGGALLLAPDCLHPYGHVDPLLARFWLSHVEEAQPLFAAPTAHAIGYAGLMLAGIAASLFAWRRERGIGWAVLLAFQLGALALTLAQLRGAYAGALLAAPALAAFIANARARGVLPLAGAWFASTGLLYPIAAQALAPQAAAPSDTGCDPSAALARLASLKPGTLLSPIDLGARAIAATPHRAVAGPYHRNTAGNLAMYRFFLGGAAQARATAQVLRADYVLLCPRDLSEAGPPAPDSLLAALRQGTPPHWLEPIRVPGGALLYRIATSEAQDAPR